MTSTANNPLYGLVLIGGSSSRMQQDKSDLKYHGKAQRDHLIDLLRPRCSRVFLSCNAAQALRFGDSYHIVRDNLDRIGPIGGISAAFEAFPKVGWLVVACDLPLLRAETLEYLIAHRRPQKQATAFMSEAKGGFEPLLTIYEFTAYPVIAELVQREIYSPTQALALMDVCGLDLPNRTELKNVNYPDDYHRTLAEIRSPMK